MSAVTYWLAHGFQVAFVTLTSAPASDPARIVAHHKELIRRVGRRFGFTDIQHFWVESVGSEHGMVHLHCLWAYHGERSFYVPQAWLSETWEAIHGAKVVDIRRVRGGKGSCRRTARYLVQYAAGQACVRRYAYSWWKFPVALASGWEALKRLARTYYGEPCPDRWGRWSRPYFLDMRAVVEMWMGLLCCGIGSSGLMLVKLEGRSVVEVCSWRDSG